MHKCSLKDVVGDDIQSLQETSHGFIDLIIKTYFPTEKLKKFESNVASTEEKYNSNTEAQTEILKNKHQIEGKELFVGSSSWPWKKNSKNDQLNLPESCACLQNEELFEMTGIHVDFAPCTQPIPWCYVKNDANCYDQVEYKSFGVSCPDCILGMEDKEVESYLSNTQVISWSTAACSKESIAEYLKKPYYF